MGTLTAISGGIGCGKSVVARIVSVLGYPVYDCDSRARALMDSDSAIKARIAREVCADAITADGSIDRKALAAAVFADENKLVKLNDIVHGAVKQDLLRWRDAVGDSDAFVETAILYESGLDRMVDRVGLVTAPEDLRIRRVMRRNGLDAAEVRARIEAQARTKVPEPHRNVITIVNDGVTPLLPQILRAGYTYIIFIVPNALRD